MLVFCLDWLPGCDCLGEGKQLVRLNKLKFAVGHRRRFARVLRDLLIEHFGFCCVFLYHPRLGGVLLDFLGEFDGLDPCVRQLFKFRVILCLCDLLVVGKLHVG